MALAGLGFGHRASKDGTEDSCRTQVIAQDREAGSQGRQNCNRKLDSAKYADAQSSCSAQIVHGRPT